MSPVAERSRPMHVDVVRRVESGHVLVLESWNLPELVGQIADDRALGWELVGGVTRSQKWEEELEYPNDPSIRRKVLVEYRTPLYVATLVRGIPGSALGMDIAGGVGNEER